MKLCSVFSGSDSKALLLSCVISVALFGLTSAKGFEYKSDGFNLSKAGAKEPSGKSSPSIHYEFNDGKLILTFTGKLESSGDCILWNAVEVDSPYTVELSGAKRFYRVIDKGIKEGEDIVVSLTDKVNLELNYVQSGTFMMGSPSGELGRESDETQCEVTISKAFWLGKYEVTQAQYKAIMGTNPSVFKGDNKPVENVSWYEAMIFCQKLTEKERASGNISADLEYTLPTEAQWEYACRAGTTTAFNNGTNIPSRNQVWNDPCPNLEPIAWYQYNCEDSDGEYTTHPVGGKEPNAWNFYDMHGNVWEWCLDWCSGYENEYRNIRGGAWDCDASNCRSACRYNGDPYYYESNCGFRVALVYVVH